MDAQSKTDTLQKTDVSHKAGLKIAHLNIRSLIPNLDETSVLINENEIDILTLNETRLSDNIPNSQIGISNFFVYRKGRNRNGGGVAIYVNESRISHHLRNDLMNDEIELVAIEVKQGKTRPIVILAWYRPPCVGIHVFNIIEDIFTKLDDENKDTLFLGDFNCDLLSDPPSCYTKKLTNVCEQFNLTQLITEATRIVPNSSTLIDLVFTSNVNKIKESGVVHTSNSDHSMVYAVWGNSRTPSSKHLYKKCRNYKKFDESKFCLTLRDADWSKVNVHDDVNQSLKVFNGIFLQICNKHAPTRKRRVKQNACNRIWLDSEYLKLVRERDRMKKKAISTGNNVDWSNFKKIKNHVTSQLRVKKGTIIRNEIQKSRGDVKKTWKSLNLVIPRKNKGTKINNLITKKGETQDFIEIANELNEYFVNVGPNLASKIENKSEYKFSLNFSLNAKMNFKFTTVTPETVTKLVLKLPNDKATGIDDIPIKLLKIAISYVIESLTHIINRSFLSGTFPNDWKRAKVIALHKGGSKVPSNYRPISILPVASKVIERIAFDQFYLYLNVNKFINKFQSGFRPHHSTSTAMLNITDEWLICFDDGKIVCVVLLDLKKAFDTVDFQLLLLKLKYYGADEVTLRWFASYLNGRIQSTSVNGTSSASRPVSCGIPQGSILGPLLFILHINDLPAGLKHCKVSMYADDTLLYCAGTDINDICTKVNEDLEYVKTWLDQNKLSLNIEKSEFMLLGTRNRLNKINESNVDIRIKGMQLKRVKKCKHLGIIIDENLTWRDHIINIQKKTGTGLHMLKTVKQHVNKDTVLLEMIYNAIVSSHLNYCDIVWDNCGVTLLNKLQKIQNRGARVINGMPWDSSSTENLNKLKWKNLGDKRKDNIAKMMYCILNNHAPTYLSDKFSFKKHCYNTRKSELHLNIIRPRSDSGKRSFRFRGAQVWNSLSENVKSSNNIDSFKRSLKSTQKDYQQ